MIRIWRAWRTAPLINAQSPRGSRLYEQANTKIQAMGGRAHSSCARVPVDDLLLVKCRRYQLWVRRLQAEPKGKNFIAQTRATTATGSIAISRSRHSPLPQDPALEPSSPLNTTVLKWASSVASILSSSPTFHVDKFPSWLLGRKSMEESKKPKVDA